MERPSPDLDAQCKCMCNAIVRAIQSRSFHVEFFSRSMTQCRRHKQSQGQGLANEGFSYMVAWDHRSNERPRS